MATSTLTPSIPSQVGHRARVWLARGVAVLAMAALWQGIAGSGWLPKEIFPPLTSVISAIALFFVTPSSYVHLGVTGIEVVSAFVIGSTAGLLVGIAGGMWPYLGRVIDPYLHYLAPTPKIIFLPLILLVFGLDMGSKIALGVISAFFPVSVATLAGMRMVAPVLIRVGRSFLLTRTQMVSKIYLPALVTPLISGLGLGLGSAVTGVLLGECKMSNRGLGFLIIEAYRNLRTADMYAFLLISFFLAVLATNVIEHVGRKLWR